MSFGIHAYKANFKISVRMDRFNMEATKLTKKGFFSSDPNSFFVIHRASENGVFSPIYQSPVVRSKSNPIWTEFTMKESQLCNGDPNRQLKIEVMKFKGNGRKYSWRRALSVPVRSERHLD